MKTLKQACVPRAATFDPTRRDTVLDLSDLVEDRIDATAFFAENHTRLLVGAPEFGSGLQTGPVRLVGVHDGSLVRHAFYAVWRAAAARLVARAVENDHV